MRVGFLSEPSQTRADREKCVQLQKEAAGASVTVKQLVLNDIPFYPALSLPLPSVPVMESLSDM